ncbi:MAG: hypothetical protein K5770_02755 [Lachnospiraceae bacterium]|nr:hypothetical protein [Lachnospiraceae bacterium]
MKIVSLTKTQLDYFKGLDPFDLLERDDIKPTLRLGAVFEGGSGDIPAGLLLGIRKENDIIILWLFVAGAFRRRGFAEELLSVVFQFAQKVNIPQVTAAFPMEYGRHFICKGRDRDYFSEHGFEELQKGFMTAQVSDFNKYTFYNGPSLEDEGLALYNLFDDMDPVDYEALQDKEDRAEEEEDFSNITHKNWKTLELKNFAGLSALKNLSSNAQREEHDEKIQIRSIGNVSLMEFKQGIELCLRNKHTGFIENLADTPPDYFDMQTSACLKRDGNITGLLLLHYEEKEQAIYTELLFASGEDYLKGLLKLIRFSVLSTMEKYSLETKVIIPNDDELHRNLIERLLGR